MVGKRETMGGRHGRGQQHELHVLVARGENRFPGIVGRVAIRVDDHPGELGKVLGQSRVGGPDHMPDGSRVIVAGDADNDIGPPDRFGRPAGILRQSLWHGLAYTATRATGFESFSTAFCTSSKNSGMAASTRFQLGIRGRPRGSSMNSAAARRRLLAKAATAISSACRSNFSPFSMASA